MRVRFLSLVVVLIAGSLFSSVFAQGVIYGPSTQGRRSPEAMKAAAAAPKPAYDPKDFSGIWWSRGNSLLMKNPMPALTPDGKKAFDLNKPSSGPRAVVPALGNDPIGRCDPVGCCLPSGQQRSHTISDRDLRAVCRPGALRVSRGSIRRSGTLGRRRTDLQAATAQECHDS